MRNARSLAEANTAVVQQSRSIDTYLAVPLAAVVYGLIAFPLIISGCSPIDVTCGYATRPESKVVWPTLAAISLFMVARNWRRFSTPPHIISLVAILAFAGVSVLWAFRPELSAIRFAQQVMIVTCVVLPALIVTARGDLVRGLFACFALAAAINLYYVTGPPHILAENATPGHTGYFQGKNYLGSFAAIALLLSMHELLHRGLRRWLGLLFVGASIVLLHMSNAKTALALCFLAPALAAIAVLLRRKLGISPLILMVSILAAYFIASIIGGFDVYKLSYWTYGDSTFTGRKYIWDFASGQVAERPLQGWGYQSFWLVGPDGPSVVRAPGWIKEMPNAHNGYLDTTLELGYVGLALLLTFVGMTLHLTRHIIDRDPKRAWILLSLSFFFIFINGVESLWLRGFEFAWLTFLIVAADVGRHIQVYDYYARARAQARPTVETRQRRPRAGARA